MMKPFMYYYLRALYYNYRAHKQYERECAEYYEQGYRPQYCFHGTSLWVDYDPICGECEQSFTFSQEVYYNAQRAQRIDKRNRKMDKLDKQLNKINNQRIQLLIERGNI